MTLVGEHRERRRAAALIGLHLLGDYSRRGNVTGAGRTTLELGNQREARTHQRLAEGPILAASGQARLEVRLWNLATALLHPFLRHRDQLLDHCHWITEA